MYRFIKRAFDIVLSLVGLIILTPLFLVISIILKFTGEGEVFYFQKRVGYKNRIFEIWKFATMLKKSPEMEGGLITLKKDPRLTPMGGFLRTSKINELPQLINILLGQMSFVGPRPVMEKSFDAYPKEVQAVIYNVKPGLTGVGSIIFRNEEQLITKVQENGGDTWMYYTTQIYPYKGQLEKWYQANQSLKTDFLILWLTFWHILSPNSSLVHKVFPNLPVFAELPN